MHPPFGFALFYLRGVAPKESRARDIYWAPFPGSACSSSWWRSSSSSRMVTYFLDRPSSVDPNKIKIEIRRRPATDARSADLRRASRRRARPQRFAAVERMRSTIKPKAPPRCRRGSSLTRSLLRLRGPAADIENEVVEGVLGDPEPQVLVVAEGLQAVVDLLELRILGRDLVVDLVGLVEARLEDRARERPQLCPPRPGGAAPPDCRRRTSAASRGDAAGGRLDHRLVGLGQLVPRLVVDVERADRPPSHQPG